MAKDPNFDLPLLCKQGKSSFFFGLSTSIDNPLPCIVIKVNFFHPPTTPGGLAYSQNF
jgi:hypothetical protein